jgi:plasmid stabilization system protein ParE
LKVVWSPVAADEFDATIGYLAERNPLAGRKLAEAVLAAIDRLCAEPLDGRPHRLRTGDVVRGWPVPPLRVYYQRAEGVLFIVRVYDQRREPIER